MQKVAKREIAGRVDEAIQLVRLGGMEARRPDQLSGGQQQRVALARALVNRPKVLLLDEPLGALDLKLRQEMQLELKSLQHRVGITFVFVTHDQAEALAIADHIAVMRDGVVVQAGSPDDVYAQPVSPWVATFLGDAALFEGFAAEWVRPHVEADGPDRVTDREFYGHDQRVEISLANGSTVEALVSGRANVHVGDRVSTEVLDAIIYHEGSVDATS